MKSFELYKFKAENLKNVGYACAAPLFSIIFFLTTGLKELTDIAMEQWIFSLTFFVFGLTVIYQAMNILEVCDDINNRIL